MNCPTCLESEARRAIVELLHRYCRAVDDRDAQAFAALWTPDAVADFGERYRGPAAGLLDALLAAHATTRSMSHHVTGPLIEFDGGLTAARCTSDVSALVVAVVDGATRVRLVRGRYDDRFERHSGVWRLAARRFTPRQRIEWPASGPPTA